MTTTAAAHGGEGCPTSPATQSCNTHDCPVNCAYTWSGWTKCSKTCGGGTQEKSAIIQTPDANGGTACPSPVKQACNTHACPVDCVGRLGGWSSCSKGCGGGTKTQVFHVKTMPRNGGKACPIAGGTQSCNTHPCPVNCDYGWSGWSSCSKQCNGGTQSRSINIRRHGAHGGRACPASSQSRSCNNHACHCTYKETRFNDDGDGNSVYFDRHSLDCGHQKMSRWKLLRDSWHRNIKFQYTCCDTPVRGGSCSWRSTRYNDDGNGESVYFDRHDISCGHNEALGSWALRRGSGGRGWGARRRTIKFDYKCCPVPQQGHCHSRSTHLNSDGGGESVYFDRHDMRCPRNEVMRRWKLNRMGTHNRIRFDYTCCK